MSAKDSLAKPDWPVNVARGIQPGLSDVHKFGKNAAIGTSFAPVSVGGIYRTPQASAATTLRVKAGNANDAPGGSGARLITLIGLDASGNEIQEDIATNGTSAGTSSANSFLRLYRAFVKESGTYSSSSAGSHSADVVIENSAGTEDWATIDSTDFPKGQTEIGAYTVPLGYTAYLNFVEVSTESTKDTDVLMFQRQGILDSAAPYQAMRIVLELGGIATAVNIRPKTPMGPFPELTDIGFMAKVATGTGEVDVDFEILLVKD